MRINLDEVKKSTTKILLPKRKCSAVHPRDKLIYTLGRAHDFQPYKLVKNAELRYNTGFITPPIFADCRGYDELTKLPKM